MYGQGSVNLDLWFSQTMTLRFTISDVSDAISGMDFPTHYALRVNPKYAQHSNGNFKTTVTGNAVSDLVNDITSISLMQLSQYGALFYHYGQFPVNGQQLQFVCN
jgi:hypothetical protein